MYLNSHLLWALALGTAVAVGVPTVAQEEPPDAPTQQPQEQQAPPSDDDQPRSSDRRPSQQSPDEASPRPADDAQRARDNQQQQAEEQQEQRNRQERRAMLGVAFAQDGDPQQGQQAGRQGLAIAAIMPGSAAEQANLQRGDAIISVNGQQIRSAEELDRIVQQQSVGDTLDLVILRNEQEQQMQVTLQAAPESAQDARRPDFDRGARAPRGWLGVTLDTQEQQGEGVTINRVYPAGPAARAGLREGDQILQVTGQQVSSYEDVLQALGQTRPGDAVDLVVASEGQEQQVSIRLDDAGVFAEAGEEFDSSTMWRDPSGRTAEIPEHDMMLEQHRRFAEQHERIEQLLLEVKQDLEEIKQQINGQPAQSPATDR